MKNSLFKRAVAAVATVPVALTQCLTFSSFAASTAAVKVSSNTVKAEDDSKSLSLDSLLYIAPDDDDQISNWNVNVANALAQVVAEGNATGTIDVTSYVNKAANHAGQYTDIVKAMAEKLEGVTYQIAENNDIVVTAKVGNVAEALQGDVANALGKRVKELAEKYGVPAIADIDFTTVEISGTATVTIKASELDLGNKVTIDVSFKSAEGDTYTAVEALNDYVPAKIAELKKTAYDQIDAIDGVDKDAVKADIDEAVKKYEDLLAKASNKAGKVFTANKSAEGTTVEAMINSAVSYVNRTFKKNISASSATEFLNKSAVADAYNDALSQLNSMAAPYSVDIAAADLGAFIDSLTDIDYSVAGGVASISGQFEDAEKEAVKAYVEDQGYVFVDSYKEFAGVVDFNGAKTKDGSSVSVEVKRILVTDTTTTSATTTDTTTSATTTDTTTSATTTDTTTSATTTDTTTSATTTDTTSSATTTDTTTSATTTDTTTSATTTDTTSSATTTDTTTSATTTDTTTSATTTDTTTSATTTDTTTSATTTDTTTSATTTDTTTFDTTTSTTYTFGTTTDTTTSATTTDTTSTTTDTTTTTTLTQVANGYYVTVDETKAAFYLSTEDSFDAAQVSNAVLHISYVEGYTDENGEFVVVNELPEETKDITEFIGFDTATPANTYDYENNKTFKYEIALSYDGSAIVGGPDAGELLKDKDGNVITVTAYIGLKGDVDFDNTVSAMDASAVLTYYVGGSDVISYSELVDSDEIYEEFAAFLADVTEPAAEKRFAEKADRTINAIDASAILTYYVTKTPDNREVEVWTSVGC